MPKIDEQVMPSEQEKTEAPEEKQEEAGEQLKEDKENHPPKKRTGFNFEDPASKQAADSIFNKMFSIESEDVDESEEAEIMEPVQMDEHYSGGVDFVSDGEPRTLSVYPTNPKAKYSIEIQDEQGNPISVIPNRMGISRARVSIMAGNYKAVIKSPGNASPFTVKL